MLKISIAQMRVIPGFPDRNTEEMLRLVSKARELKSDLIIFPEMAIPGYLLGDTWEETSFLEDCAACADEIVAASHGITIMFGSVAIDWNKRNNDGRVRKYNAFFTAQHGALVTPDDMPYPFVIKTLMPNYREFDDARHFFSLQKLAAEMGKTVKDIISPVRFSIRGEEYSAGCLLCEDGWSDDYELTPADLICEKSSPDFFVNISSSPYTMGKELKRHCVFSSEAAAQKTPLIYVNNVGLQNNGKTVYTFDGGSAVYDGEGNIKLAAPAYTEKLVSFRLENLSSMKAAKVEMESESARIYRALIYGIRLFLESVGLRRVVIGVSGGIDSSVVAALYARVLKPENILLVNMPSVYNSQTTKKIADKLAKNLGTRYAIVEIQKSVEHTIRQIEEVPIQNFFDGTTSQLRVSTFAAENIQARDRSARVLAGLAATFGGGFTCNANKTETTVGYSTLYGDQSGFLSTIADLWKYQVYDLARYLNDEVYRREVIPAEALSIVPSAELSGAQNVERGEGDPLFYPYHDYLFRAFVERWQKATPQDVLSWYAAGSLEKNIGCEEGIVQKHFVTPSDFINDLEHWWSQFSGMAVAKRIQAPPILAVSLRAFGFDRREAQNGTYYTRKYRALKSKLLGE